MKEFCIATVAYPEAENVFGDFFDSIQILNEQADVVVAEQGETAIRDYNDHVFSVAPSTSIPGVRAALFSYLKNKTNAQYYIFVDIDDRLRRDALTHHKDALATADFSYGDQQLFQDNFNTPLHSSLFDAMQAPERLKGTSDLKRGNCVGLSALGISRKALEAFPDKVPDTLIATDWYIVATMLAAGLSGCKAGLTTDYRLQGRALRALNPATTQQDWEERINAACSHFKATGENETAEDIIALRNFAPDYLSNLAKEVCPKKPMWYEDVIVLAAFLRQNIDGR